MSQIQDWPELKYENWEKTCQTLHRWTQIVGKIRLSKSPWVNHAWHSTLYVTEKGLTTSIIHDQEYSFSLEFDFLAHILRITISDGRFASLPLVAESVASFHDRCTGALKEFGISCHFFERPNELADAIPFTEDRTHSSYDPEYANRFWRVLLQCDRVMKVFRSRFLGKASPVQFFWGSFDLAAGRFSGRRAPEHPGGIPHLPDLVTRESYSHEECSCGFWPGSEVFPAPAFYSYVYPQPGGFERAKVPRDAYYHEKLREFILPYDRVRASSSPDELLLDFFQSTYEAAANLGGWDRDLLEQSPYLNAINSSRHAAAG